MFTEITKKANIMALLNDTEGTDWGYKVSDFENRRKLLDCVILGPKCVSKTNIAVHIA